MTSGFRSQDQTRLHPNYFKNLQYSYFDRYDLQLRSCQNTGWQWIWLGSYRTHTKIEMIIFPLWTRVWAGPNIQLLYTSTLIPLDVSSWTTTLGSRHPFSLCYLNCKAPVQSLFGISTMKHPHGGCPKSWYLKTQLIIWGLSFTWSLGAFVLENPGPRWIPNTDFLKAWTWYAWYAFTPALVSKPSPSPTTSFHAWTVWELRISWVGQPLPSNSGIWRFSSGYRKCSNPGGDYCWEQRRSNPINPYPYQTSPDFFVTPTFHPTIKPKKHWEKHQTP